ncbi:MAG: hypothetical protein H7839_03695 [Magnetococcus sp. YQC-5]
MLEPPETIDWDPDHPKHSTLSRTGHEAGTLIRGSISGPPAEVTLATMPSPKMVAPENNTEQCIFF